MPPFPKPTTEFDPDLAAERRRLHAHRRKRQVPVKGGRSLLIGSWNNVPPREAAAGPPGLPHA